VLLLAGVVVAKVAEEHYCFDSQACCSQEHISVPSSKCCVVAPKN
jgi:hypothetical protein